MAAEEAGVAIREKRSVGFGGVQDELPSADDSGRTARQRLLDGVRAVLDDPDSPSTHELREAVGDLGNVLGDRSASIEDKRTAVDLLSNPVLHDSFENVVLAIDKVERAAIRHPEIAQTFAARVDLRHLRGVVEKERAFADDLDAHPENHEDLIAEYREVHGAEDAEPQIAALISSTRRSARRAIDLARCVRSGLVSELEARSRGVRPAAPPLREPSYRRFERSGRAMVSRRPRRVIRASPDPSPIYHRGGLREAVVTFGYGCGRYMNLTA